MISVLVLGIIISVSINISISISTSISVSVLEVLRYIQYQPATQEEVSAALTKRKGSMRNWEHSTQRKKSGERGRDVRETGPRNSTGGRIYV